MKNFLKILKQKSPLHLIQKIELFRFLFYIRRYGDFTPTADPNPGPYYGVKGISKVSNWNIAAILFGIAIVGAALQFFLIRYNISLHGKKSYLHQIFHSHSFTLRRDALDDFSKEAGKSHANVRAEAEKYGNEKQLERLAAKFLQGGSR